MTIITADLHGVTPDGIRVQQFPAREGRHPAFVAVRLTSGDVEFSLHFDDIAQAREALVVDLGRKLAHLEVEHHVDQAVRGEQP